ncbi:thymocyte nuclear protein 1 [Notechis scutatus]|uniref:Thymocyte nuclear protein 1 n=1 Tax=Notechis scutatus TaxID=8663 RepID=A0A6J1UTS0_9SAUR|nr:thymocyte nuclear protein 1 [Notechis scutatus]XP_026534373.1 thymocyte nuclear protein 1 [Notechis scutatus]XP_026534375.1 thymocyte nuclear protein 1 [Notechis scutatus]
MPACGKKRGQPALTAAKQPKWAKTEIQKKGSKLTRSGMRKTGTSLKEEAGIEEKSKAVYSHWLMKSEPESRLQNGVDMKFGIEDLKAEPNQRACWDGVRNYQARNFLRDMKVGEDAFFYHSNCKEPGIAGLVKIAKAAYPDHTQFEKGNPHYDASSTKEDPRWSMVDVQFVRMTHRFLPLAELKAHHQAHQKSGGPLKEMALFTRPRLSIQPVTDEEFEFILSLEKGTKEVQGN